MSETPEIELIEHVQVVVVVDTDKGPYRDAFYYPKNAKPSDEVIRAAAQERADKWVAFINTPPVEPGPEEAQYIIVTEDGTEVEC